MENDIEELELAQQLRKCCNKGKEKDLNKSAKIFHDFGLLYRRKSPERISLLRSAVFFNAALIRQPKNDRILKDLEELCSHVLELVGAEIAESSLVEIANQVSNRVEILRNKTQKLLSNIKIIPVGLSENRLNELQAEKISKVKELQYSITALYIELMNFIAGKCSLILGTSPCDFSIVGMGSLARKEITPYSDFEHVIVLEEGIQLKPNYEEIVEYFRWFTVIFQLIVINLKETIIPSVAIPVLNNCTIPEEDWFYDCYTPRGISFDGMMMHASKFPLGRMQTSTKKSWTTELIKPVSEMVNYLEVEEDLKNGYHLADILARTCFVSGNKLVYKDFEKSACETLKSTLKSGAEQVMIQLRDDLRTYNIFVVSNSIRLSEFWNIKHVLYRSITLIVSALGRLYSINKFSCFEIVIELLKMNKINEEVAQKLSLAVAVACETRLKVYTFKKRQNDLLGKRNLNTFDHTTISQVVEILGEQTLSDYFCIVFSLQRFMKVFDVGKKIVLNITLQQRFHFLLFLDLRKLILAEWARFKMEFFDSDTEFALNYTVACVHLRSKRLDEALKLFVYLETYCELSHWQKLQVKRRTAHCLYELRQYSKCVRFITEYLEKSRFCKHSVTSEVAHALAYLYAVKADCERVQGCYESAQLSYGTALNYAKDSSSPYKKHLQIKIKCFLGICESQLGFCEEALQNGLESLEHCKKVNIEISVECKCNRLVGECYMSLRQPEKALKYFRNELELRNKFDHTDGNVCDEPNKLFDLIHQTNTVSSDEISNPTM